MTGCHGQLTQPITATGSGVLRVEAVMGTTVTVDVRDQHLASAAADGAVAEAVGVLHAADRTYHPDSDINRLRRGATSLQCCVPQVAAVLHLCAQARRDTTAGSTPGQCPAGWTPPVWSRAGPHTTLCGVSPCTAYGTPS